MRARENATSQYRYLHSKPAQNNLTLCQMTVTQAGIAVLLYHCFSNTSVEVADFGPDGARLPRIIYQARKTKTQQRGVTILIRLR